MSDAESRKVKDHYSVTAKTYRDQYDTADPGSTDLYPAEYFRLRNLLTRLRDTKPGRVLDAGCGEGTPLVRIAGPGVQVRGFDFTPGMVEHAKNNFRSNGLDPEWVIEGDVEDYDSFSELTADGPFDAAVCFGVMPHISDDSRALANLRRTLKPGGLAFVEFRNALFNLFTMNRLTHDFVLNDLLGTSPEPIRAATGKYLSGVVAMDRPPLREKEESGEPGYDAIRARTHNPLTLPDVFRAAGFSDLTIHWYHFHPTLPMLEGETVSTEAFRNAAVAMEENPGDWRGHFLCSAFVVEAVAA